MRRAKASDWELVVLKIRHHHLHFGRDSQAGRGVGEHSSGMPQLEAAGREKLEEG